MAEKIVINILNKTEYLKNPMETGLDKDWTNKCGNFDERMKAISSATPQKRGSSMNIIFRRSCFEKSLIGL